MFEAPVVEKQRNKDLLWPMLLLGFLAFLSFSLVALLPFYTGDIGKDDVCAHPRLFVLVYVQCAKTGTEQIHLNTSEFVLFRFTSFVQKI